MDQEQATIRQAVEDLLRTQSTLVLSTADDRQSHATPLFYLSGSGLQLYWFSSASSLHSVNLDRERRAAVAVHVPTEHWQEIRGVQMRGEIEKIADRKLRREITRRYCERFHLGTVFRVALSRSSLYVFRPRWVRYLDNSRRFGFKYEFETDGPGPDRELHEQE